MDFVLMGLLVAALWFGVRLDKKLKALRGAHEGFAKAVGDLDQAAIRAHHSLKELRADADESQDLLHGRILAARDLLQKLETQVGRAERAARELDGQVGRAGQAQVRAEEAARRLESAPRYEAPRYEERRPETRPEPRYEERRPEPRAEVRPQPRLEEDADYNPAWSSPKAPSVARGRNGEDRQARDPFERDIIRFNGANGAGARRSVLPEVPHEDESDLIDKVQMSELVVANLNEMIRSLTMPSRQPEPLVRSVEDDLFGGEDAPRKR
ncbi:DUF6468 domain-containing protein [Asticcacaulis solisilvae]|uniref:DUF6468 domain-containing protein n=1 Tax=Asticcacaulis solisilvae TaxID=1217274 RepID=UPI003FD6D92F